jgi:hypothetical protein
LVWRDGERLTVRERDRHGLIADDVYVESVARQAGAFEVDVQ